MKRIQITKGDGSAGAHVALFEEFRNGIGITESAGRALGDFHGPPFVVTHIPTGGKVAHAERYVDAQELARIAETFDALGAVKSVADFNALPADQREAMRAQLRLARKKQRALDDENEEDFT